jgi:hypothetical protein
VVKDASGNVVELQGLQPDGTILDVSEQEAAEEAAAAEAGDEEPTDEAGDAAEDKTEA